MTNSLWRSVRSFFTTRNILALVVIIVLVTVIRLPIDYRRMMTVTDNDYTTHIYYALDMLAGRPVPAFTLAHSFWQLFLIFMWWASRSRIDFWQSAIGLQVVSSIAATVILYIWFGTIKPQPAAWKRVAWAVTLVIVTPVIAPTLLDGAYYFGYIGLANYHNPTVHVLRPLALVMFFYALSALEHPRHSFWHILVCALVFAAGTFLKPSYTVSLGPVLVGVVLVQTLVRRQPVDWRLLVLGMGLPSVLFLAPQYVITYLQGEPDGGIALMPFAAARMLSGYLPLKFLMSIFFPLVVLLLNFRRVLQDRVLWLAWLVFAWGAAQFYLLIELGSRYTHANFVWGAQITLFVVFAATARFLLGRETVPLRLQAWRALLLYAAYLLHIISGVSYYLFCYLTPHYG